jgi:Uma2 family endonuclease
MTRTSRLPKDWTNADLLHHLGDIDPRRVRIHPPPGRATVSDLIRLHDRQDRLYELVDGVLVEKVMGVTESYLAGRLIQFLGQFADEHGLGFLLAPDGALQIMPELVRIPDVSFISWAKVPKRKVPNIAVPDLHPDLAVEVLSRSNTRGEMQRKLKEYFLAGVRLVWFVGPDDRSVTVYTAPDRSTRYGEAQSLDGGEVLPGFALPLKQLFAEVDEPEKPAPRRRKRA